MLNLCYRTKRFAATRIQFHQYMPLDSVAAVSIRR